MLKKNFIQNSFKYKLRIIGKFGHAPHIVEKPLIGFNKGDLEFFKPKV
jgi:hypothetical protein